MLYKDVSEALEQMTNYSERYKWRSKSSRKIMQLYEDSLTLNNFRFMTFKSFNHLLVGYNWSTRVNDKLLQKDISEDQWVVE